MQRLTVRMLKIENAVSQGIIDLFDEIKIFRIWSRKI